MSIDPKKDKGNTSEAYLAAEAAIKAKWAKPPKTEPVPTEPPPLVSPAGFVDKKFTLPAQAKVTVDENLPKAVPYMAMDVDKNGLPVYGNGLQGWARKAWADLTDPVKYFYDLDKLSQEKQKEVETEFKTSKEKAGEVIEEKLSWSKWGEKLFGISAEELGTLGAVGEAERTIAKEAGESAIGTSAARQVRLAVDTTQNFIWLGLNILGADDAIMRRIHATSQGLDAVADRFNEDKPDNIVEKLWQDNPIAIAKDVATIAFAISTGKLKFADAKETVSGFYAGSQMAYTMLWDEAARAEFEKGIIEGKNPETLAQEYGNIGIELAGSVLGSPSTYLGLALAKPVNIWSKAAKQGMVVANEIKIGKVSLRLPWKTIARIPNFGEILGIPVGKLRLGNEKLRFVESALPDHVGLLEKATKDQRYLVELKNAALARYSTEAVNTLDKMAISKKMKWWNLAANTSDGKISVASKDADLFMKNLVVDAGGVDTAMEILVDMANLRKGGSLASDAAERLIGKPYVFSAVGEMVGEVVARLDGKQLVDLIGRHGDNPTKLHQELFQRLEGVLHEFIPSVDEMLDASKEAKKLISEGALVPPKTQHLADMADDLPEVVKVINRITRVPEAISNKVSQAMVYTFMNLVPRQVAKNIEGAFIPLASRVGFMNAASIALQSLASPSAKKTASVLMDIDEEIRSLVDFVPMEDGLGKIAKEGKGVFSWGFLPMMKRSEMLMGRQIIRQVVKDEIQAALPAVVKGLPEWDAFVNALPKEQKALPFAALTRANGNPKEAEKILRGWIGTGEIEVWKLTEPPPALRNYLESNDLLNMFYKAQNEATTHDEFKSVIDDIVKKYEAHITEEAMKLPHTLDNLPSELNDFAMDYAKQLDPKSSEVMNSLIQASENTQRSLADLKAAVLKSADSLALTAAEQGDSVPQQTLNAIRNEMEVFHGMRKPVFNEVNTIRDMTWKRIRALRETKTRQQMIKLWKEPFSYGGKKKYSLPELYPQADLGTMTNQEFDNLALTAMFDYGGSAYRNVNSAIVQNTMGKIEEIAKVFKSDVKEMAGAVKAGDNPFHVLAQDLVENEKFEELAAQNRFFRQLRFQDSQKDILLKDVVGKIENTFSDWKGGKQHIVNAVNKNLSAAQVPVRDDVYQAVAKDKNLQKKLGIDIPEAERRVAGSNVQTEKRQSVLQKLLDESENLTEAELRKSHIDQYLDKDTGMLNKRAYLTISENKFHALIDADGLGAYNRYGGYSGGDAFIKAVANQINEAADKILGKGVGDRIRWGGDEFVVLGDTQEEVDQVLKLLQKNMDNVDIRFTAPNGVEYHVKHLSVTGATGKDFNEANRTLKINKEAAVEGGIRPPKGSPKDTLPPRVTGFDVNTQFDDAGVEVSANVTGQAIPYEKITLKQALDVIQEKIPQVRPRSNRLPTQAETLFRGLPEFKRDAQRWSDAVVNDWGKTTKTLPTNVSDAMRSVRPALERRMKTVKLEAAVTGVSTRNFVLHDYNKTYMDQAMTYLMGNSFHYWTTRTYMRAIETMLENPKWANVYMNYKEYNVKRHANQPDWYRQNVQIDSLMGIPLKNPLFMNLEQSINPVYGIVGTDFNDPRKRVDWVSRMVDDANKMGPTFSPLISWAIAAHLYKKGYDEAGQRWAGRLLPQSQMVKSTTAMLGRAVEVDPFVNLLGGGVDAYEKNRVVAALAVMVRNGEITQEQMIEASRTKSGEIWQEAINASATARFGSDATSFFLGAGIRPRTQDDMVIEKFWQDYNVMVSGRSMMTPEQYRLSWDKMRDNPDYGQFMDALLLSRKSGDALETAYIYNVFGRIPPGQLNDMLELVNIRPELAQSFYDNKGDWEAMGITPQDRQRLMAGAIDIAVIKAMPTSPTRKAWAEARGQYAQMNDMLVQEFGEGILELMSEYYSVPNQSDFLDMNPDVQAAMEMKDQIVLNNPILTEYYGGIQTVERYYTATMEKELMKVYGNNIKDLEAEYYDMISDAEQKAFKKQNPQLEKYWKDKTKYRKDIQRALDLISTQLPDTPVAENRPNAEPANSQQEAVLNLGTTRTFEEWTAELGAPLTAVIVKYAQTGKMDYSAKKKLDSVAKDMGYYDGDALIQAVLKSVE